MSPASSGVGGSAGLVSLWSAEGNSTDSVNGNHGTLMNGASFAAGISGQAFSLDGIDDYIEVANAPALTAPSALSVEAWIRLDAIPDYSACIAAKGVDAELPQDWTMAITAHPRLKAHAFVEGTWVELDGQTLLATGV